MDILISGASVAGVDPGQAVVSLFFTAAGITYERQDRHDVERQRRIAADAFAGAGWRVPRLLDAMRTAPDLWFDATTQVRMERWSRGRVALLGDAGHAGGPGGNGTGLAVVPPTDRKIAQRNRFFRVIRYLPPVKHLFRHLATRTATAFDLPDYGVLGHTRDLSGNRGNVL